ncbi:MAG: hypothetical protein ACLPKI_08605, partial [Streptosporangiaceae bacterium]
MEETPAAGRAAARSARARRLPVSWPAIWLAVLGGLAALSMVAMLPLSLLAREFGSGIVAVVIGIPCAGVGVLVARRQPGNPLGWIFLVTAIFLFLATDGGDYAFLVYRHGYHLPLGAVGLACDGLWIAGLGLFVVVILLFPDGTVPSAFWRWALRAYGVLYAGLLAALVVETAQGLAAHPVRVDATGGLSVIDNPAGWFATVQHAVLLALLAFSLCFIGYQVLSWRRSVGERRQQVKWLAGGAAVTMASLIIGVAFSSPGPTSTIQDWVDNIAWFGVAALPVSMGVGILRYRLYEIDRIISRTLAYAIVTALLVGLYAGLVLLSTHVLSLKSPVAVAASTLAAAALFNPLRRRVQRVVDRRFNRARYDAGLTVAAFAARLKDAVDLDSVRGDLAAVVQETLEPAHVSVWLA